VLAALKAQLPARFLSGFAGSPHWVRFLQPVLAAAYAGDLAHSRSVM